MFNSLKIFIPIIILLIPGLWISQGWTGEPNTVIGFPILFTTLFLIVVSFILGVIGTSNRPGIKKQPIQNWIRDMFKKFRLRND